MLNMWSEPRPWELPDLTQAEWMQVLRESLLLQAGSSVLGRDEPTRVF
jgi:hypothetical protein